MNTNQNAAAAAEVNGGIWVPAPFPETGPVVKCEPMWRDTAEDLGADVNAILEAVELNSTDKGLVEGATEGEIDWIGVRMDLA